MIMIDLPRLTVNRGRMSSFVIEAVPGQELKFMSTAIGVLIFIAAIVFLFRATAFAARAALSVLALVGVLIILVPLLIAN